MIIDPITISPEAIVADARELMRRTRSAGIPVVDGERLVGIVTTATCASWTSRRCR